jgi:hypothetical protein
MAKGAGSAGMRKTGKLLDQNREDLLRQFLGIVMVHISPPQPAIDQRLIQFD